MRGNRFFQMLGIEMGQIQINYRILGPADFEFMNDGAGDDVARGQFGHGMVLGHEAIHLEVAKVGTFAPQGLREKKARGFFQVERGGMELDELHVADFGAGTERHGDAIAGGNTGVGGVAIELAEAAGGEEHGRGGHLLGLAFFGDQVNAADAAGFDDQVGGEFELHYGNIF